MRWANFLHIYQPYGQSKTILGAVANQSYRRLFLGMRRIPSFKLTLNINAALTEMLIREGYRDIIGMIRDLAERGRVEFTESAKYHALLPFLSMRDIIRQITLNHEANRKYFGAAYKPSCLFPPEMAYTEKVARAAKKLGYRCILADEISFPPSARQPIFEKTFAISGVPGVIPLFRERRISNLIMSAVIRNLYSFRAAFRGEFAKPRYLLTAMDGETFGHHRPGLERLLLDIMRQTQRYQIFVSEIPALFPEAPRPIRLRDSTWASSEEDLRGGVQFYSWKNPGNPVHRLQWQLFRLVVGQARRIEAEERNERIERALASDHFFWASAEPWWSIEMIEKGAWLLREALRGMPGVPRAARKIGFELYHRIIAAAFRMQRPGIIENYSLRYREAVKIPFKERTLEAGKPEVYAAAISMMRRKMKESAKKQEFEKAILWRDAIWKLETKNDIYDAIHAVDLLRQELPHGKLERLMDRYKKIYKEKQPGQPEPRRISQRL